MSLLWCDGFDHYGTTLANITDGAWADTPPGLTISATNPRTGTYSLRQAADTNPGNPLRRVLGGPKTTAGIGGAWWLSDLPISNRRCLLYGFNDASNLIQVQIIVESTGIISAYQGFANDNILLGQTSTPAVTAEAYTHIEAWVTIGASDGMVEVRVNGVAVLSLAGVNTDPQGSGEVSQVTFLRAGTPAGYASFGVSTIYLDDVMCADDNGSYNNDFIGDRRVLTLFPNADTAQNDWSWTTGGTAYQNVNEADPDDDTNYIFANPGTSPNPITEFDLENMPAGVSGISAVQLVHRSRKTDAGTANIQTSAVSGASEFAGSDRPMTEAYTYYHDVVEVDPDTLAPFTPSAVDSMKIKIERTQ